MRFTGKLSGALFNEAWWTRVASGWRTALYGGFQATALGSAGWVVFLILRGFFIDWPTMLASVLGVPALHLGWEFGGDWILGRKHRESETQSDSGKPITHRASVLQRLKRLIPTTFAASGFMALVLGEKAGEHLEFFLASLLLLFPAGVILTIVASLAPRLWDGIYSALNRPDGAPAEGPQRHTMWQTMGERWSEVMLRVLFAIPLSVIVAGMIAFTTALLSTIVSRSSGAQSFGFLSWWVPAAFGFTIVPYTIARPRPGSGRGFFRRIYPRAASKLASLWFHTASVLTAIALLVAVGFADTHWQAAQRADEKFWLDGRENQAGTLVPDTPKRAECHPDGAVTFFVCLFDPRNFLEVVADPYLPPSFSFEAQEELPEGPAPGHAGSSIPRRVLFCPGLTQDQTTEARHLQFWMSPREADLKYCQKHYGTFCSELQSGLESHMLRSWFVLLFFAWGIMRAVSVQEQPAPSRTLRPVLNRTLAAIALPVALAMGLRLGVALKPDVTRARVSLPAEGGKLAVNWKARGLTPSPPEKRKALAGPAQGKPGLFRLWSWIATNWNGDHAREYQVEVRDIEGVPVERSGEMGAQVTIPANRGAALRLYEVTVRAKGWLASRSGTSRLFVLPRSAAPASVQTLDGPGAGAVCAAAVGTDGAFYVAGKTSGSPRADSSDSVLLGDPTNTCQQGSAGNGFLSRFDTNGKPAGHREIDRVPEEIHGMAVGGSGSVFLQAGDTVAKYNPSMNRREWHVTIEDTASALALDDSENVYIAGTTKRMPAAENTGIPRRLIQSEAPTQRDAFLIKYDTHGKYQWRTQFGTNADDGATGVAVDSRGSVYVVGFTCAGFVDSSVCPAFLEKLNGKTGRGVWVRRYGAVEVDSFLALFEGARNGPWVAVSGQTEPSVYVSGGDDDRTFVGKYRGDGASEWFQESPFYSLGASGAGENGLYVTGHLLGENSGLVAFYGTDGRLGWIRQVQTSQRKPGDSRTYRIFALGTRPGELSLAGQEIEKGAYRAFVGKLDLDPE